MARFIGMTHRLNSLSNMPRNQDIKNLKAKVQIPVYIRAKNTKLIPNVLTEKSNKLILKCVEALMKFHNIK